jgi:hypothetical protein
MQFAFSKHVSWPDKKASVYNRFALVGIGKALRCFIRPYLHYVSFFIVFIAWLVADIIIKHKTVDSFFEKYCVLQQLKYYTLVENHI